MTVKCEGTPVKCHPIGSTEELEIPTKDDTTQKVHMSHARAPNGSYWKFDCNII